MGRASDLNLKEFTKEDFDVKPEQVSFGVELGKGNFSVVYKGTFNDETVAIKKQEIVDPDLEKYLLKELAILKRLESEFVIKFFGAYREGEKIANILTEYIEGGDLRRLLQDKTLSSIGWKLRSEIALGCARGVLYLHDRDLIHRDIKTENVLLDKNCRPKICDFGFARQVAKDGSTMTMCGTDEFMAPEIIFGMPYDLKADVYSFGIMLAEVMTRKIPGKEFLERLPRDGFGINVEEFDEHVETVKAPQSLALLAKDCLNDETSARPSALDILEWLEELLADLPDDNEEKPNLSQENILKKLDAYIHRMDNKGGKSEVGGGSNLPSNEEQIRRVQEALAERDAALSQDDNDYNKKAKRGSIASSLASLAGGGGGGAHKKDSSVSNLENQQSLVTVNINDGASTMSLDSTPRPASGGGKNLMNSTYGGTKKIVSSDDEIKKSFLEVIFPCIRPKKEKVGAAAHAAPDWERQAGWVTKRGGRIKTWKKRYMVLTALGIVYFKTNEIKGSEAQGTIEFSEMAEISGVVCNKIPTVMAGKPNSFGVHTLKRTYYMAAENAADREAWVKAIQDGYLEFNNPKKKKKSKRVKKKKSSSAKSPKKTPKSPKR